MVNGINPNFNPGMQNEAMAATGAMIVTGLEKELGVSKIDLHDKKIDRKQIDEFVQKLVDATAIDSVKKYNEKEQKDKRRKEEEQGKRIFIGGAPTSPAEPFEWITFKKTGGFFDFFYKLENRILSEILKFVLQPNLDELVGLAKELNIDLSAWKLDRISIDDQGRVLLNSDLSQPERLKILLLDECKILEIGKLLEDSWIKLAFINFRLLRVKNTLKGIGIKEEELKYISLSARRIAFLKMVAVLKDLHMKRVFSTSRKEFDIYSQSINMLTKKIWKIDADIPKSGLDWIHKKLETLALESARYKLELLRSMQKLAKDPERAKNIHWLEQAVKKLGNSK
ncbi:MAG: hypothetical protein WC624_05355 [Candidatus Margulisiibacteriota bacterium]